MDIERLVVGDFGVNCYIVSENGEGLVIDPGEDAGEILETAASKGITIKYVLLTHGHFDHTGAAEALRKNGARLYVSRADEPLLTDGNKNVANYFGCAFTPTSADGYFEDSLDICNMHIDVIPTPGHTMGGVCFLINGRLFSGDTLFDGSVGRCDFPGSDGLMLIKSIKERLFTLPDETPVYPGHNGFTTIGNEKKYNMFLK